MNAYLNFAPQAAFSSYLTTTISAWLETAVCLCILLLLWFSNSTALQGIMFDLHVGMLAIQVG